MTNKRMFSIDVVDRDNFYDLPFTSQLLYFHLGMRADVKGFVEPKKVIRTVGLKNEDLKPLIEQEFIILFESGVIVITDWNINNNVREDREAPTRFIKEFAQLTSDSNGTYILQENSRSNPAQIRLDKIRLDKINTNEKKKELVKKDKLNKKDNTVISYKEREGDIESIIKHYNEVFGKKTKSSKAWKKNAVEWLKEYSIEDIKQAMNNWKKYGWWIPSDEATLSILFRTKNGSGECDYIDQLLNLKKTYVRK